jgi:hypothetical protein
MPNRRSPAGYVVEVTIPGSKPEPTLTTVRGTLPDDPHQSVQFFNAALSSGDAAIRAVRKVVRAPADASMRIVRMLSPAEVAATHLHDGEVKPA